MSTNEPRPFSIRIYVAEGLPEGLRLVEKSNWIGLGIICPRSRYREAKKRDDFSRPGVYILIGYEDLDRPMIYIGESETIRNRLDNHYANKDFWQQAIIFTATEGSTLNKAQIQHLEARLYELAEKNNRCELKNENRPSHPTLLEAMKADMEGYLDEMLLLLPVLGINAFKSKGDAVSGKRTYRFSDTKSLWNVSGYETSDGFLVRKGGLARLQTMESMKKHVPDRYNKRKQLIEDGTLIEDNGGYRFTVDYVFSSPSQAASICAGRNANGLSDWKDDKGVTLKKHREQES